MKIDLKALQTQQTERRVQGTQLFRPHCLLPLTPEVDTLEQALQIAYTTEVQARGHALVADTATRTHIRRIAEWLTNPSAKPWLLIYGGMGNGKTTLLRALQSFVNSQHFSIGNTPVRMLFRTSIRLCQLSRESRELFDDYTNHECLAIDDLGVEPVDVSTYGTRHTPIVELLLHRYERMRFTVISSNLSEEQLTLRYGERIADRLREVCDRLYLPTPSYRY